MTTANETTVTETPTKPQLFREEKRKVREKDLMVGVWYESDGEKKTAFIGKVFDLNDNELFSERVEGEKFEETDGDAKLKFDKKAYNKAKKLASDFAANYGKEPSEQETVVANLKRLRTELVAEFSEEKLNEMLGLIEKLAA